MQGIVDPASGLPASLDARFKSGTAFDRSHAGIVLRHLRISGQVAPVDVNPIDRNGFVVGMTEGYGGAFEYGEHARLQTAFSRWVRFHTDGPVLSDGGSSDPSNLVQIVFIEMVFDHNSAGS